MDAISLKDAALVLIGAGLIMLIFYGVVVMKNLVVTVKHTNRILEDAQVVSKIAADRSRDVDKAVEDITVSVGSITSGIKGNQSTVAALTSIVNALASIKNILIKRK